MKRLICVLLTLVLTLCLSSAVLAEPERYPNILALLEHWENEGFPDDIGSIYSTDGTAGNLTVQIVSDDFEARAEEIRAMLTDPGSVTFERGQFTDKRLHEISAEIREQFMTEGSGITNVTTGWGANGGFGPSGQEMRVVVSADEDRLIELAQELGQRYGDAVIVQPSRMDQTQQAPEEAAAEPDPAETAAAPAQQLISPAPDGASAEAETGRISEKTESTILSVTFIALGALAAFLIIFLRRRNRKIK